MKDSRAISLPNGWTVARVGDVCADINYGYTASASAEPSGPRFLRITDIQDGQVRWASVPYCTIESEQIPKYALNVGDIVFARTGGTVGKSFLITSVPEESVFASYLIRLSAHEGILPKFLYYFFQSGAYWEQIGIKKGGLQGNVNATTLSSLEFPICPFNEQARVVAKIEELFSELDNGIESLKTAREQLKVYHQALLKHAFEGKLTSMWREENKDKLETSERLMARLLSERETQYRTELDRWSTALDHWGKSEKREKRPVKPKKQKDVEPIDDGTLRDLPELPNNWIWVRLGQLTWSVKDGPHYSPKYQDQGIPFISGGNVRPEGIDFSTAKFISQELHEELCERCKPEVGDILYTKGGTTGIARVNTYDIQFNVWVHVAVLKIASSIAPFFLQHALNSHFCYVQAQRFTHGVGNQDLGLTRMVNIVLPICGTAEQYAVVSEVERVTSEIDELQKTINAELLKAESLRQSLLKDAFAGNLVAQDPNDEPASILLERIRRGGAEKDTARKKIGRKDAA